MAEVSQIAVSCETVLQFEFKNLHRPAGVCIPVASVFPIHVPPTRVPKHCDVKRFYI